MPPSRRAPPKPEPSAPDSLWWVVAAAVVVVVVGAGVWWLCPREDKLAVVTATQRTLLAAGGAPDRATMDALIRTVDRMSRREVWAAYRTAEAEWKRLEQEAVSGYFAAGEADRPGLLDEHLERMVAYHDLLAAMNPRSAPDSPASLPRQRRRREDSAQPLPPAEAEDGKIRAELAKRFADAVAARAKARGVPVPEFR